MPTNYSKTPTDSSRRKRNSVVRYCPCLGVRCPTAILVFNWRTLHHVSILLFGAGRRCRRGVVVGANAPQSEGPDSHRREQSQMGGNYARVAASSGTDRAV